MISRVATGLVSYFFRWPFISVQYQVEGICLLSEKMNQQEKISSFPRLFEPVSNRCSDFKHKNTDRVLALNCLMFRKVALGTRIL